MATIVTKIVDTGGGEGADYTSLAAWEAAEQCDLVALNLIKKVYCRATTGVVDSTPVVLSGWTTSGECFPWITTEPAHSHNGYWSTGKYRLVKTDLDGEALIKSEIPNYRITGLQFYGQAIGDSNGWLIRHTCGDEASHVTIANNIFRSRASGTIGRNFGIDISSLANGSVLKINNNLFYDFRGETGKCYAFRNLGDTGAIFLYYNTVYNAGYGYRNYYDGRIVAANNMAIGCSNGFLGVYDEQSIKNLSDISDDAPGLYPQTGTPTFLNVSERKFDLHSVDTTAKNKGKNIFSDPAYQYAPTEDILGRVRPYYSSVDIGCFEHTPITVLSNSSIQTHQTDNLTFTQTHILQIAECLMEHTIDGLLPFTQLHILIVEDVLHGHTAENCPVNIILTLVIQDADHGHTVDGALAFDQFINFAIQDALQTHTAENMKFTQLHLPVIQDGTHGHTAENCSANINVNLVIAAADQGHTVDGALVFTQEHNIDINNVIMAILSDHIQINPSGRRVIAILGPKQTVEQICTRVITNLKSERIVTVNREILGD